MNTSKEKKHRGGVFALAPQSYELFRQWLNKYQKLGRPWWAHPVVIVLVTVSFSVLDAFVLYSLLDEAMVQSEYLGKIIAFGIAIILNIIPLLAAKFVHQAQYKTKRMAAVWAMCSIAAFMLLFASTVYLRFAFYESYGSGSGAAALANQVGSGIIATATVDGISTKSLAIILLLCAEPLVTSVVNFLLAYMSDDEVEKAVHFLELRRYELNEMIGDLRAAIAAMNNRKQEQLTLDWELYVEAENLTIARGDKLRAIARLVLAEYLQDPSATTKLTSEMMDSVESDSQTAAESDKDEAERFTIV